MSGKRSLSILKSTQLTWSQISWEEENTLNSTQMTWRSRKILSQNSQIHTIDLESNKFRGRKHSEFHSNDLEIKKNPLNFFENNMSWEDFFPLKYLQVRWSFSQRFRVFFPRLHKPVSSFPLHPFLNDDVIFFGIPIGSRKRYILTRSKVPKPLA